MRNIIKYPRTPHISGSRLQKGDEDLKRIPFETLKGKHLVIEEKLDGANCGLSFQTDGSLFLQSRGHYLTGGYRERHFALLKTWAGAFASPLFSVLGNRYVLYGEWLYAKHTVYYDALPHYFFEFDIWDCEKEMFLDTHRRREMLEPLPFVHSVPVLYEGALDDIEQLSSYVGKSLYRTENWRENLQINCESKGLSYERALEQTDDSDLSEGLYIKHEENGEVLGRYKFVRNEFVAQILSNDDHWLDRPIIPNELKGGQTLWT